MNEWINQYAQVKSVYPELGGWLLCALKSTSILMVAAACAALLRSQSARAQNWAWRCGLGVLLFLGLWQILPQGWGLLAWKSNPMMLEVSMVETASPARNGTAEVMTQLTTADQTHAAVGPRPFAALETITVAWWAIASLLAVVFVTRSVCGSVWLRRNSYLMPASDISLLKAETRVCAGISSPILTGLTRPIIYLPAEVSEWTAEKKEDVFSHEMAHWSRGDVAWQMVGKLTSCLWWWNPLVWVVFRQLKSSAEQAADDLVVLRNGRPQDYAKNLVEIASSGCAKSAPSMSVPMLGQSSLETRIRRILSKSLGRNTFGLAGITLLSGLAVVTILCAAANIVLAETSAATKSSNTRPHYQADVKNNVLPQGEFAKLKGKMEGWSGTLDAVSFPEGGLARITPGEKEAVLETKISRNPDWQWLTVMVRTRPAPGTTLADHQGAISIVEQDASGNKLPGSVSFEQSKRSGYVNWGARMKTFRVASETKEILVQIQLGPGPGKLDISEIYLLPSRPDDELQSEAVNRFYESVKANDLAAVKEQLAAEPRLVNARNGSSDNGTPLIACAWNELPEMAQLLIENGADLDAQDINWKSNALTWCGWWGSPKTAEVLLKAGADPKFRSVYGVTPLSSAQAGKSGNKFSKRSQEEYDQVIAIFQP